MVARADVEGQQERESIWSVSKGVKHVYFALFIGLFSAGTLWTVAQGVASVAALWRDLASLAITAAWGGTIASGHRAPNTVGFAVQPRRWVVERTCG